MRASGPMAAGMDASRIYRSRSASRVGIDGLIRRNHERSSIVGTRSGTRHCCDGLHITFELLRARDKSRGEMVLAAQGMIVLRGDLVVYIC